MERNCSAPSLLPNWVARRPNAHPGNGYVCLFLGVLSLHIKAWEEVQASRWIIQVIRLGYHLPWDSPEVPLTFSPPIFQPPSNPQAVAVLDQVVASLLSKGATEEVLSISSPGFYGQVFVVPKSSGGWRPAGTSQLVPERPSFPEGYSAFCQGLCPPRRLGDVHRPFGCFLSHPHSPSQTKVAPFYVEEQGFPVSSPPFWSCPRSLDFYLVSQGAGHLLHQRGVRLKVYLHDWLILAS